MTLKPRTLVPSLDLDTLGGMRWSLGVQQPAHFTMIVFYRGLHCPVCRKYLMELNGKFEEFVKRGVGVFVASTDSRERAERANAEWGLANLEIGYEMTIDKAREWGLYISSSRGKTSLGIEEPALFAEPGFFLVRPDGTLYWANISTMPFVRPHFDEIVQAIDFVLAKNYPARGEA